MCVMVPAEIVRAALDMPISTELWALIDREQRRDLPAPPWPDLPADQPLTLVAPLTPEQIAAGDAADAAYGRLDETIRALYRHPAPRALNCGRYAATIHLRRDRDGGAVEDALIRTSCGRSDCPHCWRRRLTKSYRRAAGCLLDAARDSRLPRVGHLHVAETTWQQWEAYDRSFRRQHGGDCGRLRVRRCDDTVLVVSAEPFRGSRPLTPADALDIASAAIRQLNPARHGFRLLGDWSDAQRSEWRQVAIYSAHVDLADINAALTDLAITTHAFRSPDYRGLLWRAGSEAHAIRLEVCLAAILCPTLAPEVNAPPWAKSDTEAIASAGSGDASGGEGYDPAVEQREQPTEGGIT